MPQSPYFTGPNQSLFASRLLELADRAVQEWHNLLKVDQLHYERFKAADLATSTASVTTDTTVYLSELMGRFSDFRDGRHERLYVAHRLRLAGRLIAKLLDAAVLAHVVRANTGLFTLPALVSEHRPDPLLDAFARRLASTDVFDMEAAFVLGRQLELAPEQVNLYDPAYKDVARAVARLDDRTRHGVVAQLRANAALGRHPTAAFESAQTAAIEGELADLTESATSAAVRLVARWMLTRSNTLAADGDKVSQHVLDATEGQVIALLAQDPALDFDPGRTSQALAYAIAFTSIMGETAFDEPESFSHGDLPGRGELPGLGGFNQ